MYKTKYVYQLRSNHNVYCTNKTILNRSKIFPPRYKSQRRAKVKRIIFNYCAMFCRKKNLQSVCQLDQDSNQRSVPQMDIKLKSVLVNIIEKRYKYREILTCSISFLADPFLDPCVTPGCQTNQLIIYKNRLLSYHIQLSNTFHSKVMPC